MRWFWLICLTAGAVSDIRSRSISCRLLAVCAAVGLLACLGDSPGQHIPGLAVGLIMLAFGRVTGGGIGTGDGLFFMASAWYLSAGEICFLFLGGLTVSWVWAAALIVRNIWSGEDARRKTLPFLACLWPAGVWLTMM